MLAHHFMTARMPDRAADYLEKAAQPRPLQCTPMTWRRHLARAAEALQEIDAAPPRRYSVAALREEILNTLAERDEQGAALGRDGAGPLPTSAVRSHRRRAVWLAHLDGIFTDSRGEGGNSPSNSPR